MKTKWMILPVVALALGCSREMDTNVTYIDGEFTLYATSGENDTKTVIQQDGRIFWSPSDCITVFYGNVPGKFTSTNTEPAASAEFTGSLGSFAIDGETEFRAIYPHSNDVVTPTDEGILSIYLPSEQTGVEGTFADDLFICVAKSKDVNLHFYNVCGGVKFSLASGDIKKVVFRGNNRETLAGRMAVEFDSNGIPQVTDMTGGKSSVTLLAPDGGTFKAGSFYYLVLVPQSLTKGYTMELWTDELVETVSSEASVTVRRSAWGVLKGMGESSLPPIPDIPSNAIDLGLSIRWADCNLGASAPEEYGGFFAWGETEQKEDYSWTSYKWYNGSENSMTKYNSEDNKTMLDPEDDAAHVILGGNWRMPTYGEWMELFDYCNWTWTTQNGVEGYRVTSKKQGFTDKYIFLPGAGFKEDSGWYWESFYGGYWISSLKDANSAMMIDFTSDMFFLSHRTRRDGLSVRPVYEQPVIEVIPTEIDFGAVPYGSSSTRYVTIKNVGTGVLTFMIENVSNPLSYDIGEDQCSLPEGASVQVAFTYTPTSTTSHDRGGCSIISNTTKRTVNVTYSGSGTDSQITSTTVVDLGLSVKWAACNLGASRPEGFGYYYAWGETEPKNYYSLENYKWYDEDEMVYTKYDPEADWAGRYYEKNTLELEDDAAYVNLGSTWMIPSPADFNELIDKCTWTWTSRSGVAGYNVSGPNGRSIFFPAAGNVQYDTMDGEKEVGYYRSSQSVFRRETSELFFDADSFNFRYYSLRWSGNSIRPIYFIPVETVSLDYDEIEVSNYDFAILNATVYPADAMNVQFRWEIDGADFVSFQPKGDNCIVRQKDGAGLATLTVYADNNRTIVKTATCRIVSKIYITDVELFAKTEESLPSIDRAHSCNLVTGESMTLVSKYYPEDATEYTDNAQWMSDDPSIASVTLRGVVTGKKPGTTTIRVKFNSWNNTVVEASYEITVSNTDGSHEGFENEYWD